MPPVEQNKSDSIVQVDERHQLMSSDDEEQQHWKMRSIYRVPTYVTDLNHKAYQPQVVSFGPYHHGEAYLLPMEKHKRRAFHRFVKRSKKPCKLFFESLRQVAQDLQESYDALDLKWKAGSGKDAVGQFLELMITDGCFMLEILRFATYGTYEVGDYAPNDPIFSKHGMLHIKPYITRDMLMLENQLPMLVLDQLLAVESNVKKDDEYVNRLILKFCSPGTDNTTLGKCLHVLDVFRKSMLTEPEKKDKVEGHRNDDETSWSRTYIKSMGNFLHVLDVFRKSKRRKPKEEDEVESNSDLPIILSATNLREHGIQFKNGKTYSLRDISFASGVLRLPMIMVADDTESMFLNLMAFERLHVRESNEVTSYIFFMDTIIDDSQDVALLRTKGIILNVLQSDEAAAKLFNSLAKEVIFDPCCSFNDVPGNISKYCNKRWNMWRANLIHTYFRNPWVILSLVAAVFLFALTIIQTVYTVLGYHK